MNPASTVRIRRMVPPDLGRVVEIEQSLAAAPHWRPSAYRAAVDPEAMPRRIALVAEETSLGVIAGFVIACLISPQSELETIAVDAEFQRRGLARKLFAALAAELRLAHSEDIFLELRVSNRPALSLYQSLGFVETGRRPRYYHDPVEDAVLMRLPL